MTNEITRSKMKIKRNRIGQFVLLEALLALFFIVPTILCGHDVTDSHVNDKPLTTISNASLGLPKEDVKSLDKVDDKDVKKVKVEKTEIAKNASSGTETKKEEKKDKIDSHESTTIKTPVLSHELDSGAVVRAFYVFVGLSLIVMAYLVFRSFRLRSSPVQMVRKYGVLAHKQDIEMRPLPLDDDDDDDTTVFDASKLPLHSNQIA